MKSMITLLALTFSLAAFAQDSVDLVLSHMESFKEYRSTDFDRWKYAKVKFPRKYYDEMMKDSSFTMNCYSTLDKGVQLVIGQGQMAVFHKDGLRGNRGGCNTSQCMNSSFEDFEREANTAYNDINHLDGNGESTFRISSIAHFNEYRRFLMSVNSSRNLHIPNVEEIPYVTIYSPKAHQGVEQVTNSFACYLLKRGADGKRSPVEP